MMGKNWSAPLDAVVAGMQKMKNRITLNLKDGQKDLKSGSKSSGYKKSINPFKKHPGEDAGK